jgi:Rad3-related DNA helicase
MTVKPKELGLPRKFKEFRPEQWEAVETIAASEAKVVLLQAPTGVGKTVVMAALGKYLNTKILYTCHTKQLQDQVRGDFPYAVELKGRSNYSCAKSPGDFPHLTANECTKNDRNCITCMMQDCGIRDKQDTEGACPCVSLCDYLIQKNQAKRSSMAVLNMPLFLAEANFVGDFSGWPWIVLDEGDLTEDALMSFIQVSVTKRQIDRLGIGPPAKKTVAEAWVEWMVEKAIPAIDSRITKIADSTRPADIREAKELGRLQRRYRFLSNQSLDKWAFVPSDTSWDFKPIFISSFAQHNLWEHGERFLVMSATILSGKHFARHLGLKESEVEMIDLPSPFPPKTRPIFFMPATQMTHKNKDSAWPEAVEALDNILDKHPDEKGLVHTVSYPLTRFVLENSRHKHRFLQHDMKTRIQVLNKFKKSASNDVLVSPSMDRGIDLPGNQCSFVVILKIPSPNIGDAQISRRLYSTGKDGQICHAMQTIRSMVQSTGRGVRFSGDTCVSYIIDTQFIRLYNENRWLIPRWWLEALVTFPRPDELERWRQKMESYATEYTR